MNENVWCKIGDKGKHLLRNPRVLPCGAIICLTCLQEELRANGNFRLNCSLCDEIHYINDVNKLDCDKSILDWIDENLKQFTDEFVNKLQYELANFTETYENRESLLDSIIDNLKDEIDLRIESLKYELDNIRNVFYEKFNKIKGEISVKLNDFSVQNELNYQNYFKFLNNFPNTHTDSMHMSQQIIKENLYLCESYLFNIKQIDTDFHKLLRSVKFRPSEIEIDSSLIGHICDNYTNTNLNLNKLQNNEIKFLKLDNMVKMPYYFCKINRNLIAVIDIYENEIYLLNRNFNLIRRIVAIGDIHFDTPLAMCVDEKENVFLCDSGNDRILVTDKYFTEVQRVIGRKGKQDGQLNHPRDTCYYKNSIYVLDYYNQSIQIFDTITGEFIRKFRLYNISQLPDESIISHQAGGVEDYDTIYDPYHIAVYENTIAIIDYRTKIFIYNFNGDLKHIIEQRYINTMCFIDGYLFTHGVNGLVTCYDSINYTTVFKRIIESFQRETHFIVYFNDCLLFGFKDDLGVI